MDDTSRRLTRLAQILSDARPYGEASVSDSAEYLCRVRLQRMQHLTAHLDDRAGRDVDDVDAVAMRLLLDQYAGAVVHLRATAGESARMLADLAATVRTDRRLVDEQLEQQEKRFASAAPSDRLPASRNPDT